MSPISVFSLSTKNDEMDDFHLGDDHTAQGKGQTQIQQDAFQAEMTGQLPNDRILIGEGQKLSPTVVELFGKVDVKLRVSFA